MYKLVNNPITGQTGGAIKTEGDKLVSFVFDPANTDYQAYLAWLAEGNTPQGADE